MQETQLLFLLLSTPLVAFGIINLFYTERYFFWRESRTYANPLEPSVFKLRTMRLNGTVQLLGALAFAYLGIAG